MVLPIQRLLRRAIKAYIARRDERQARIAYASIAMTIQATIIQRAYRKYATSLLSALSLAEGQQRPIGTVNSLVRDLAQNYSDRPLAWLLECAAKGTLEDLQCNLREQVDALVQARLIRSRCDEMRVNARRKLHACDGKLQIYARVADGSLDIDTETLSKEARSFRAKEERLEKAVDDLIKSEPPSRSNMRSLADRCNGALVALAQLASDSDGTHHWMGVGPTGRMGCGQEMASRLLNTRQERLVEQREEEEAQLGSKEKLLSQLAVCRGSQGALVTLMRELNDDGVASASTEAARQHAALQADIEISQRIVDKYEGQRTELEMADQHFERSFGANWLIECALATRHEEQQSLLNAVRLQAFAHSLHYRTSRTAMMAHHRWLRELGAFEQALFELRQREDAAAEIETREYTLQLVRSRMPPRSDEEQHVFDRRLMDSALLRTIVHDAAIWGSVMANEEELHIERVATKKTTSLGAAPRPETGDPTFLLTVELTPATRGLIDQLQMPNAWTDGCHAPGRSAGGQGQTG
jgi:hypothetical protein